MQSKISSDKNLFILLTGLVLVITLIMTIWLEFRLVNAFIVEHVVLGSIAFFVGAVALISRKGSALHKLYGQLFYGLMTASCVLTLIVASMPFHISFSMFQISVMSLYFLIGGKRSLQFRKSDHQFLVDKILAYVVIVVSLYVMLYSVVLDGTFYPLRTVFGVVGCGFALVDLFLFKKIKNIQKHWLSFHLSKMTAGYTTAVTGFFVAQNILGGYYNWFTPTVVCLFFIFYSIFKLNKNKQKHSVHTSGLAN